MPNSAPSCDLSAVTVKQAADALATRAVAVRAGREKTADFAGMWNDAKNWAGRGARSLATTGIDSAGIKKTVTDAWNIMPGAAQTGLIGAGVGGAAGLGLGMMRKDKDKERHPWSSALLGALAGGAIGAGGHLVAKGVGDTLNPKGRDAAVARDAELGEKTKPGVPAQIAGELTNPMNLLGVAPDIGAGVAAYGGAKGIGKFFNRQYSRVDPGRTGGFKHVTDPNVWRAGVAAQTDAVIPQATRESLKNAPVSVIDLHRQAALKNTGAIHARSGVPVLNADAANNIIREGLLARAAEQKTIPSAGFWSPFKKNVRNVSFTKPIAAEGKAVSKLKGKGPVALGILATAISLMRRHAGSSVDPKLVAEKAQLKPWLADPNHDWSGYKVTP